jgi:hypothetical protein
MMRSVAVTGSTDVVDGWFVDRQQGRWAQQTFGAALPPRDPHAAPSAPAADPAASLALLTSMHERGLLTDAELAALRAREGV